MFAGSVNSSGYKNSIGVLARFREVRAIFSLNSTSLLVVDSGNHCLRIIDGITLRVTDFVGRCTYMGFKDGYGIKAELDYPYPAVLDQHVPHQTLFFLDKYHYALRRVDLGTQTLNTVLVHKDLSGPEAMTWDYHGNYLIIATSRKIIRVTSLESTPVTEEVFRFTDKMPVYQLVSIYYDLYILSRKYSGNSSLSLFICDAKKTTLTPLLKIFRTAYTQPLKFREQKLYVGMYKRIVVLTGMSILHWWVNKSFYLCHRMSMISCLKRKSTSQYRVWPRLRML